jgi:sugar lactone lactonase YvrE
MIYSSKVLAALVILWSLPIYVIPENLDGVVTTFAGTKTPGSTNGIGTSAKFSTPGRVAISSDGTFGLISDSENWMIRHVFISTVSVTTLAGRNTGPPGSTNGVGTNAKFWNPTGITISPDGLIALVADSDNNSIRRIDISTASVTLLVGGAQGSTNGIGTNVKFDWPNGVSMSPNGSFALIADSDNNSIRHLVISTATVTSIAGLAGFAGETNGIGTNAKFSQPFGLAISPNGLFALIADSSNCMIRHLIISTATVTTLAGTPRNPGSDDGIGTNALFFSPNTVSISPDSLSALVADTNNQLIRRIIISTTRVTTSAGVSRVSGSTNGIGTNAKFSSPSGLSFSPDASFALVVDSGNNLVRKMMNVVELPTVTPTSGPTTLSITPTFSPTTLPTVGPTVSISPSISPSTIPTVGPTPFILSPTMCPTTIPTLEPTMPPSVPPTHTPSNIPTLQFVSTAPTFLPTITTDILSQGNDGEGTDTNKIIYISVAVGGFALLLLIFAMTLFWSRSRSNSKFFASFQPVVALTPIEVTSSPI